MADAIYIQDVYKRQPCQEIIHRATDKDFDKGASRDSGYIYGPGAPRSYFAGVKLSFMTFLKIKF